MLKSLKKVGFLLFTAGCTPLENFVDSKITVTKISSLKTDVIEKFSNKFKTLDLSGAQEIAKSSTQSIIKNSKEEFFLISKSHGDNKFFDMEKISLPNDANVKSFFFLENKLYALCLNGSTVTIYECFNKISELGDDVLPLAKININTAKSFSFNAADPNDLGFIFRKIQNNIWRQRATAGENYSSLELKKLELSLSNNIHCCSIHLVDNENKFQKGCFIFVQTEVKEGVNVFANINLGLFFDGKNIVPCQELASDNSFFFGDFNKFSITSLKSCGNTIVCRCKNLKLASGKDFSDFVIVGKLIRDSEGNVCYKLISSHFVENLKDVSFIKTECEHPILTTLFIDNSNQVKFGTLVEDKFRSQNASDLVGIDLFKTNAELPNRTRLRDYNAVFVGDNSILLQYKNYDGENHAMDYLITLNNLQLPMFS